MFIRWLPVWVWIPTAGDHTRQGQAATAAKRHGPPLGKSEQHRAFHRRPLTGDRLQALLKRLDGCWDSIPVGGEKAIPLAARGLGMEVGSRQRHHLQRKIDGGCE